MTESVKNQGIFGRLFSRPRTDTVSIPGGAMAADPAPETTLAKLGERDGLARLEERQKEAAKTFDWSSGGFVSRTSAEEIKAREDQWKKLSAGIHADLFKPPPFPTKLADPTKTTIKIPLPVTYGTITGGAIHGGAITGGSISAGAIIPGAYDLSHLDDTTKITLAGVTLTKQELQELLKFHPKGDDDVAKKPMTLQEKELLTNVGLDIVRKGKELDLIFEIDGTPTLTIRKDSGEYRKKPMFHGWGFFLTDAYVGNRDSLIFVLDPVDPEREMKSIEVSAKEADSAMPLMGSALAEGFGIDCEGMPELVSRLVSRAHEAVAKEEAEKEAIAASLPNWGRF